MAHLPVICGLLDWGLGFITESAFWEYSADSWMPRDLLITAQLDCWQAAVHLVADVQHMCRLVVPFAPCSLLVLGRNQFEGV